MEITKEKLEQIGLHLSSIREPATFVSDDYAIVATKAKAQDGWRLCIINKCATPADDAESIGKMFNGYCTTMEEIHKAMLACGIKWFINATEKLCVGFLFLIVWLSVIFLVVVGINVLINLF